MERGDRRQNGILNSQDDDFERKTKFIVIFIKKKTGNNRRKCGSIRRARLL
jgi:hypothetical protein